MANRRPVSPSKEGGCYWVPVDGSRGKRATPVLFKTNGDPDIYANPPNSKVFKTNLKIKKRYDGHTNLSAG